MGAVLEKMLHGNRQLKGKNSFSLRKYYKGVLYILTSVWVLHTQNAGCLMLFQCLLSKKLNKRKKKQEN